MIIIYYVASSILTQYKIIKEQIDLCLFIIIITVVAKRTTLNPQYKQTSLDKIGWTSDACQYRCLWIAFPIVMLW